MAYTKEIIVLVGPQACGKSTYCTKFLPNYFRISQDDMGKKKHREIFTESLGKKDLIVIDRMNFNKEQRARYLVPAKEKGYRTRVVLFNTCFDTCLERLKTRKDHPTLKSTESEDTLKGALGFYFSNFEKPMAEEADVVEEVNA